MSAPIAISRRSALKLAGASGAVFALGLDLSGNVVRAQQAAAPDVVGAEVFGTWLRIDRDNTLTLVSPEVEYGQGTITANAMLIAEELDADWSGIRIEASDARQVYSNPKSHRLSTDGSWGTRGRFEQMRRIGATARTMIVQAAAAEWHVPISECATADSIVSHPPSGRSLSYGALAATAALLPLPRDVPLREPEQWRLIGRSVPRLDVREKSTGQARYGVDVRVPGMLHAAIARCPQLDGTVKTYADATVRTRAGVRQVISLGFGVAVLADDPWTARDAAQQLHVDWYPGKSAGLSTESLARDYERALAETPGVVAKNVGDVVQAQTAPGARVMDATYTVPYLAHQCTEPTSATAWVHDGVCEFWTSTASMENVLACASALLGLQEDKIIIHRVPYVGGSFGLRGRVDPELEAAQLSKLAGVPVQVLRRREDDVQHSWYRPYQKVRLRGTIDAQGALSAWNHKVAVQGINSHFRDELAPFGIDLAPLNEELRKKSAFYRLPVDYYATSGSPLTASYQIPNLHIEAVQMEVPVPVTHWRSVGYSGNLPIMECFLDELAHAAAADPIEFRRTLLAGKTRHLAVLDALAAATQWPSSATPGVGWGIAFGEGFEAYAAAAVEVAISKRQLEIRRVVCVCDQGLTINMDQSEAQIQGGLIDGLSAALYGEITLRDGRVLQSNYNNYRLLTLADVPPLDIRVLGSTQSPGSITEIITPVVIPALSNAVFAANGERVREWPLARHGYHL